MKNATSRRVPVSLIVLGALAMLSVAFAAGLKPRSAYRYIAVFQEVWGLTRANYVDKVDESALLEGAYRGMLASLDASSAYLSDEEKKLIESPPGTAHLSIQVLPSGGVPVIVRVDPDGAGDKAGLKVGDQIWRINGQPARQSALDVLERRLSGEPGQEVELVILDSATYKLRSLQATFQTPATRAFEMRVEGGNVSYVRIRDLARLDVQAFSAQLSQQSSSKPLLVDARGLVGNDVELLTKLAGSLLAGGSMLELEARDGSVREIDAPATGSALSSAPTFVLVDGTTAGIGEALALLLREQRNAKLGGRKTFGLSGVPEMIEIGDGAAVLLTTHQIRTAAGTGWDSEGLEPDELITLPRRVATDPDEEPRDRLLEAALTWVREDALELASAERPAA